MVSHIQENDAYEDEVVRLGGQFDIDGHRMQGGR